MKTSPGRGVLRLVRLFSVLCVAWLHGMWTRPVTLQQRSRWRQRWCRAVLRALQLDISAQQAVPQAGLLVSNHLGYLDVLVLGALTPAVFVSKSEVRHWPLVGALCARAGTIFLERERPRDAVRANRAMAGVLRQGLPVVVFPEGTTTAGAAQLPFRPALFEAASSAGGEIWPLALSYWFADGTRACAHAAYAGDISFAAHLLRFTQLSAVHAIVQVTRCSVVAPDRGSAATQAAEAVRHMLQRQVSGATRPGGVGQHFGTGVAFATPATPAPLTSPTPLYQRPSGLRQSG